MDRVDRKSILPTTLRVDLQEQSVLVT